MLGFLFVALASNFVWAESPVFTLWEGPLKVSEIPLLPPQIVGAWYAVYIEGPNRVVLYLTQSPYLELPSDQNRTSFPGPEQTLAIWNPVLLPGGWTWIAFVPQHWTVAFQKAWLAAFVKAQTLLPSKLPGRVRPVLPVVVRP